MCSSAEFCTAAWAPALMDGYNGDAHRHECSCIYTVKALGQVGKELKSLKPACSRFQCKTPLRKKKKSPSSTNSVSLEENSNRIRRLFWASLCIYYQVEVFSTCMFAVFHPLPTFTSEFNSDCTYFTGALKFYINFLQNFSQLQVFNGLHL